MVCRTSTIENNPFVTLNEQLFSNEIKLSSKSLCKRKEPYMEEKYLKTVLT